jgi:uncharacterized protein YdaU (DUF1376 family)
VAALRVLRGPAQFQEVAEPAANRRKPQWNRRAQHGPGRRVMGEVDIFMPFFPADYLADTLDLTTEEHGAYLLLMMALWRSDGSIEYDPARLATTTRVSLKRWPSIWGALSRFFVVKDGRLSQGRLLREIDKAIKRKKAAAKNGRQGGIEKARLARISLGVSQDVATSGIVPNGVADSASSSPSPEDLRVFAGAPARDPGAPVALVLDPKIWRAGDWLRKFSKVWADKYELTYGGGTSTAKACGSFGDQLDQLPEAERVDAQGKADEMFRNFFADPSADAQRHPFAWFVTRFDSLRSKPQARPPNGVRGSPPRDDRYGHARAEDNKHTRTGEVKF